MVNNKKPKKFSEDNFNANHVDSLSVIREVKKHQVIYDTEHPKYHDQSYRNEVWDQIYASLYPNYWQYNPALQLQIGALVRRRWKSVRNYIAQESKLMLTTDYNRKRETTQWAELQFILPYIKSPYCEKVAAEMGLKRLDPNTDESFSNNNFNSHASEVNDANDRYVIHEFIKQEEPYEQYDADGDDPDYSNDDVDDVSFVMADSPRQETSLMTTTTTTSAPPTNPIEIHSNVTLSTTSPISTPKPPSQETINEPPLNDIESVETESVRKRSRTESTDDKGTSTDMQQKLLDLLITIEHRQLKAQAEDDLYDLDRMFFMSLLSDFKQIPAHKKIVVKAKIATIIAEAMS